MITARVPPGGQAWGTERGATPDPHEGHEGGESCLHPCQRTDRQEGLGPHRVFLALRGLSLAAASGAFLSGVLASLRAKHGLQVLQVSVLRLADPVVEGHGA